MSEVAVEAFFFFPVYISSCSTAFVEKTVHLVSYLFVNNIMSLVLCFSLWMFDMNYKNERIICFFFPTNIMKFCIYLRNYSVLASDVLSN